MAPTYFNISNIIDHYWYTRNFGTNTRLFYLYIYVNTRSFGLLLVYFIDIYIYIFKKLISDKAISTNLECRYCICSSSPSHQTNLIIIRTSSILSNHSNGKLVIFHILNNVYYVYITNCCEKERENSSAISWLLSLLHVYILVTIIFGCMQQL